MATDPATHFAGLLDDPVATVARHADGAVLPVPLHRYLATATAADEAVADVARGPVLDVGCGPGRMLDALRHRGVWAVGLDRCPAVVAHARRRGRDVLRHDVFDPDVPGGWGTALLLDGNVGIGGDPARLLSRVAALLAPGGTVVCEVDPPGAATGARRIRLESGPRVSTWFDWAAVGRDGVRAVAVTAGLRVQREFDVQGRWFACLG